MASSLRSVLAGDRRRWAVLVVVCFGQLMIVLDSTIVNVALPAIQGDLGFSQSALTWVVNAYLIAFGSFLLFAGRLSDLLGSRTVFLSGLVVFTVASALCGLAVSPAMLVAARFAQGFGAALIAAVVLAIVVTEFPDLGERRRAMGVYSMVATAGAAIGLLAGGVLTQSIDWHWIFFINLPLGTATIVAAGPLIERRPPAAAAGTTIDVAGAVLITLAAMIGIYAIVGAADHGWGSASTLGLGALAMAVLGAFAAVEARSSHPLVSPAVVRLRTLMVSCVVRGTLVTAMFTMFFLGSLYLERVRGYDAIEIGLAFLPTPILVSVMATSVTARVIRRVGRLPTLLGGLAVDIAGMALLTTAGPGTAYLPTLAGAFALVGIGVGASFIPLLELSMADVPSGDVGLASGIVQVSMQIAGAFGLAVLSTIATGRTNALLGDGVAHPVAFSKGFTLACGLTAAVGVAGLVIAVAALRRTGGDGTLERDGEAQAIAA